MLTELSIEVRPKRKLKKSMGMGCKCGRMVPIMKVTGKMACSLEMESTCIRMEMSMRASGSTTRLMAMAFTSMQMAQFMKVNGLKIIKKDSGLRYGQMAATIQEAIASQQNKAMVTTIGKMVMFTWEIGT